MAYKKDQFHYLSTLCNPIIVKHRYYFQQNVINIISSSPSFLFRSQKPPASQVRRFATSVFVSCTPAQNEMPASPSLDYVFGLQKRANSLVCSFTHFSSALFLLKKSILFPYWYAVSSSLPINSESLDILYCKGFLLKK